MWWRRLAPLYLSRTLALALRPRDTMSITVHFAACTWIAIAAAALAFAGGCMTSQTAVPATASAATAGQRTLTETAEAYTKLVLALGVHDADYVDAYYGPPEWRAAADSAKLPVADRKSTRLNSSH